MVQTADMCNDDLTASMLASLCDAGEIDVPGCSPGADNSLITKRIGTLLGPLFKESVSIEVEGFVVERKITSVRKEERKENRQCKTYCFRPRR